MLVITKKLDIGKILSMSIIKKVTRGCLNLQMTLRKRSKTGCSIINLTEKTSLILHLLLMMRL